MLQIGAALFYYKLGQTLLQIGAASLLQIAASVVSNWGGYYKLGQPLLQNRAATLKPRIIGGVGIIGGLDIVITINNRGGCNKRGLDWAEKIVQAVS